MSHITAEPHFRTGRPLPGEYADYASEDIAGVPGDDAIEALAQLAAHTPPTLRLLASAAEGGLTDRPQKWTLEALLSHLIDDERILAHRVLRVAASESGEQPAHDEYRYAARRSLEDRRLDDLLAEYGTTRAETLGILRDLPAAAWTRRGPVDGHAWSVRGLAFHIAGHEIRHLRLVCERHITLRDPQPKSRRRS